MLPIYTQGISSLHGFIEIVCVHRVIRTRFLVENVGDKAADNLSQSKAIMPPLTRNRQSRMEAEWLEMENNLRSYVEFAEEHGFATLIGFSRECKSVTEYYLSLPEEHRALLDIQPIVDIMGQGIVGFRTCQEVVEGLVFYRALTGEADHRFEGGPGGRSAADIVVMLMKRFDTCACLQNVGFNLLNCLVEHHADRIVRMGIIEHLHWIRNDSEHDGSIREKALDLYNKIQICVIDSGIIMCHVTSIMAKNNIRVLLL